MRFIVPRNLTLVLSKESFMVSARELEDLISSPMATVIYKDGNVSLACGVLRMSRAKRVRGVYIF